MALFVYSEAMTCCRAFINNKKIRRQDMGRIKRVREFGDPDYIRIDQAVFKFKCKLVYETVNSWFRYTSAFYAPAILELPEDWCSRHTRIVGFEIPDLFLDISIQLSGLTLINPSGRNECIKTSIFVGAELALDCLWCKVFDWSIRGDDPFCGGVIKESRKGIIVIPEAWNKER